jgi:hypothetical protein
VTWRICDAPAPLRDEVLDGEAAAREVVDRDGAEGGVAARAVDEHGGDAALAQPLEPRGDVAERGDEHAVHVLLLEQVEVRGLAVAALVAVAEDDREAGLRRLVFRAACHVGEEGVAHVEHDETHGLAASGAQLPGGVVADEAELVDGLQHAGDGARGDLVGPVEHVGDGADRHARALGDVAHASDAHRAAVRCRSCSDDTSTRASPPREVARYAALKRFNHTVTLRPPARECQRRLSPRAA